MFIKLIIVILFFVLELGIYSFIDHHASSKKELILSENTNHIKKQYQTIVKLLEEEANIAFETYINRDEIKEAFFNKDREKLYSLLENKYATLVKSGYKQIHFHTPKNLSFLRMHKPEQYGDDLTNFRYTVDYVNKTKKQIHGIETGRVVPGYRNVYPIFYKNQYAGSVELSFSVHKIIDVIESVYGVYTHFLMDKKRFENMVFLNDRKYFNESVESKNLIELARPKEHDIFKYISLTPDLKNLIDTKLKENKDFYFEVNTHSKKDSNMDIHYSVAFVKISDALNKENMYFVFYELSDELRQLADNKLNSFILSTLVLISILIAIYYYITYQQTLIKSKENIKKEKNKYKGLMDTSTDGIHIVDSKGNIVETSHTFANMIGYEYDEVLKLNILDWDKEIDSKKLYEIINEFMNNPGVFRTKHTKKDGTVFDAQISVKAVEINAIKYLYAASRDISKDVEKEKNIISLNEELKSINENLDDIVHQRTEEFESMNQKLSIQQEELQSQYLELEESKDALYKSSIEYEKLFHEAPNLYLILNKDFKIIKFNKVSSKYFNLSKNAINGLYFPMLIEKEYREDFIAMISDYKNLNNSMNISLKTINETTNRFKMIIEVHPTNKKLYIVSLVDIENELELITEVNNINRLLKSEYERFELAIEGSQNGIFDWDIISNEIYYSSRWKEVVGYKDDELKNEFETWEQLVHPDDLIKVRVVISKYLANPIGVYEAIFRMKHKDGHWVWINARGKASLDAQGNPIRMIGFHADITLLEEYKNSLEEKVKEQVEIIRSKDEHILHNAKMASLGEMIENISHQWRQPLNIISIQASGLSIERKMGIIDEEQLIEGLDMINSTALELSNTIDTFRDYVREDKIKQTVELNNIIDRVLFLEESIIKKDFITVEKELDDSIILDTYRNEIEEVLVILINNAHDQFNEKKIKNPILKIETKKVDEYCYISICDNAGGVPEDIIDRIFEPYFTTKHKAVGTGLGLHISYKIVTESLGGDIYVENKNDGACFTIKLLS